MLYRLGLILCLTMTLPQAHARGTAAMLVVGDSISAAYGIAMDRGWVALLEARLRERSLPFHTINASISGDTTAGGLRRLPDLLREHTPSIVIIELGGNDGLRGYPVTQLQDNLEQMISLSQDAGATVLLLPMEIPPNLGKRYTDAFRDSFTHAAAASGAALGRFPLERVALNPVLMQDDGIHPTAEAQPAILDTIWESLEPLLSVSSLADQG